MASYNYMMSADEVAQELNCSKSHAYKLVKAMNKELSAQGYITMAGRIPKAFWAKKMYGYEIAESPRERYIDGIWNKENIDEWLTEIQVPVRKK